MFHTKEFTLFIAIVLFKKRCHIRQYSLAERVMKKITAEHYIVGIGASAGGLDAIQKLFAHIRTDSGVSVIIQQLYYVPTPARAGIPGYSCLRKLSQTLKI